MSLIRQQRRSAGRRYNKSLKARTESIRSLFWLFKVNLREVKLKPSRCGNEKNRDRNIVSNVIKSKTE